MAVITSPVKKWPGTVTLPDELTFPQYIAWEKTIRQYKALGADPLLTEMDAAFIPGVLAVVVQWDIPALAAHLAAGTLPVKPRPASHQLIAWLVNSITPLVREVDEEDPKDLPASTPS